MTQKSLADLAAKMRGIDIAMLSTRTASGEIASRPMSNNGDVNYDGDSYVFTRGARSGGLVRAGVDMPDLALIKVHAKRIKYWEGEDEGEVTLAS